MTTTRQINIVILGAGYAGVFAANRISKKAPKNVRVTVINPRDQFVERVRLHQLAAGTHQASVPLKTVLHRRAEVMVAEARSIEGHTVVCSDGREVPFDYLMFAVGSRAARNIPGSEHAFAVSEFDSASSLQRKLASLQPAERVNVIGGGLTAIETVTEIAEAHKALNVHLYSDEPVASPYPAASREYINHTMRRLGVTIHEGHRVRRIHPGSLEAGDGDERVPSAVTVLAAGFRAPELAQRSGFTVDHLGRIRTDEYLRSLDDPAVFAIGDAGIPPAEVSEHLRMACATANPMGAHSANNVLAVINGAEPKPFSLGYVGHCVSIGSKAGILQFVNRDDTAKDFALKGRTAATLKKSINNGLTSGLRLAPAVWRHGPKNAHEAAGDTVAMR
ncbi:FAD-dependent oxidoreductase [Hoyosella sp. YIM 151337]|uniref:NAD(P)/FAD-dependent oxidoreductase n=1 Tax=Hoyosella sp. YIM 151337 TaxID=2992742 RepID=UPI00223562EE|nr:FAD-dependent oxidoreductase [Hoyosella sp. YIM 151337]MCW4354039.1 FAD-dependent oxidoreductase [Hoyosella sp. YIM 151337]